ncbi:MAG: hypothetical protein J6Y82_03010 [Bacteroidales bacterium]|nr:hypothetical protein [Bacteroidales bacterium]
MSLLFENIRIRIGHYLNKQKEVRTTLQTARPADCRRIIILSDQSDNAVQKAVTSLKSQLKVVCPRASVVQISYCSKQARIDNTRISDHNIEYINNDDFTFFFRMKNEAVKKYISEDYDFVVLFTNHKHIYLDFVLKYIKSPLKIGHKNADGGSLNFVIDTESDDVAELSNAIIGCYSMMFSKN